MKFKNYLSEMEVYEYFFCEELYQIITEEVLNTEGSNISFEIKYGFETWSGKKFYPSEDVARILFLKKDNNSSELKNNIASFLLVTDDKVQDTLNELKKSCTIQLVYTMPEYRRKGLATKLIKHVQEKDYNGINVFYINENSKWLFHATGFNKRLPFPMYRWYNYNLNIF